MNKKHKHDIVVLHTRGHGTVTLCLECRKCSKDVFTEEELDVMVEFATYLRENGGKKKADKSRKRNS